LSNKGLRKWLAPFELDKRYKMPPTIAAGRLKAIELTQKTIEKIDKILSELYYKDVKIEFLNDLYYNFGAIMCGVALEKMSLEGKTEIDQKPGFLKKLSLPFNLGEHMRCYDKDEVTFHPYKAEMDDFQELIDNCKKVGLTFTVTGESEYFPGHSFKLIIKRKK
jgi:hypothetical protein